MDHRDALNLFGSFAPRGARFDARRMVLSFAAEGARAEVEHALPCRMEVCADCGGRGSYANPGIDAHGISSEEWSDWDDEDREHYLSGGYDVTCEGCRGQRVVPVPVEADGCSSAAHKAAWAAYTEWADEEADYRAERAAEIRMGY